MWRVLPIWDRSTCVNNLPKVVTWKWNGRELNPWPLSCESNALPISMTVASTLCQSCSLLPPCSRRTSPPFDRYQSILLCDRGSAIIITLPSHTCHKLIVMLLWFSASGTCASVLMGHGWLQLLVAEWTSMDRHLATYCSLSRVTRELCIAWHMPKMENDLRPVRPTKA